MKFEKLEINGLVLCKPKIIKDERGFFSETFRKDLLEDFISEKLDFCQHNTSQSSFGVLRGLHFQTKPKAQTKLVSVSSGEILDVVLDLRKDCQSFGKDYSVILNDIQRKSSLCTLNNLKKIRAIAIFKKKIGISPPQAYLLLHCGISSIKSLSLSTPYELERKIGRLERTLRVKNETDTTFSLLKEWIKKASQIVNSI